MEEIEKGEICIMSSKGDTKVIWDPSNEDEVEAARAQFDMLVKEKGFFAYEVGKDHERKGTHITKFPEKAGKIIMVAPVAGG